MVQHLSSIAVAALVGSGVITGLLFAFSNFVLRGLGDLPNEYGMFAMQRINERIMNPLFLTLFLGTPLACVLMLVVTIPRADAPGYLLLSLGAVAYLIGPFGITAAFNVPLNNRLAVAASTEADTAWPQYQKRWQFWNHLRSYVGVVSVLLLALGLASLD